MYRDVKPPEILEILMGEARLGRWTNQWENFGALMEFRQQASFSALAKRFSKVSPFNAF